MHKSFRFNIILRVILIACFAFGFFWISEKKSYFFLPVLIVILLVVQTIELILYAEKTNRNLKDFLEAIRFSDFSRSFATEGLGASFDDLKNTFNAVIKDFQKIRSEKEQHYFYLQKIIEHVDIALIAYKENGDFILTNNAAKNLFKIRNPKNISQISNFFPQFITLINKIKSGQHQTLKMQKGETFLNLLVSVSEFATYGNQIKLVSFKNISGELEEQELESWQKLIKVLTHEIMNSIAPIVSLTSIANNMTQELVQEIMTIAPANFDTEQIEDLQKAISTIHNRSEGLLHFVETYRNLTQIPEPQLKRYFAKNQFENISKLMENILKEKNISFQISVVPAKLKITADEQLIEQILINLVKNSIQAFNETSGGEILLSAYISKNGRETITVEDNGTGILPEAVDKIFIPFYTTKSNGSGIGLSLSRQIMRQHGGSIKIASEPNIKTCFTLIF